MWVESHSCQLATHSVDNRGRIQPSTTAIPRSMPPTW
jgi:hypothetical protein